MDLNQKKIFVAGATGMVGSAILRDILGYYPQARIRASCHRIKPSFLHKQVDYVDGDLKDIQDARRMVRGCDYAIMAAAYTGGAEFVASNNWMHMKENLLINLQMLEAFLLERVKRFIYIGSATLYQESEANIKEQDLDLNKYPNRAYLAFGWAIRFIEQISSFLHQQHGIEAIVIRASNIFGPYARFDPKASNFIPAIIRKAVDRMDPFEVWGTADVARDVIYVDDFARACVMLLENDKYKFDVFNVGSGVKTTVGEVVTWALKYAKHTPHEIKYIENMPTTVKSLILDCSKIRKAIDWQPRYTQEEGIKKTAEWWIENKERWNR